MKNKNVEKFERSINRQKWIKITLRVREREREMNENEREGGTKKNHR